MKNQENPGRLAIFLRITLFLLIFSILFEAANAFFSPLSELMDTVSLQIYEEEDDTIEVVFFGSSQVSYGINTMQLYEDYGICAYNMGTALQPALGTYYWIEELYEHHSETLQTVVLDVTMLAHSDPTPAAYHKTLDGLDLSLIKLEAVQAYEGDSFADIQDVLSFMVPLFAYHASWESLTQRNFDPASDAADASLRGYLPDTNLYLDKDSFADLELPLQLDDDTGVALSMTDENRTYLQKIVYFCHTHNIELILFKTPDTRWSSEDHYGMEELADAYGVTFLDMTVDPIFSELDYNYASDCRDDHHANYYGAVKITDWLGAYLTENNLASDVRGDENYTFMETALLSYKETISETLSLVNATDVADYLAAAASNEDLLVFVMVNEDGATELTEEQRDTFAELGLTDLAELEYGSSYIGVIRSGEVICDHEEILSSYSWNGNLSGVIVNLESGGYYSSRLASCIIDGEEYAANETGINIVVYDLVSDTVIDSTSFDTSADSERTGSDLEAELEAAGDTDFADLSETLQKFTLYNLRATIARTSDASEAASLEEQYEELVSIYRAGP